MYYYPFYIKNINIQYFECPPLASNTALICLGMFSIRFRHSSVGMSRTQDDLMVLISDGRLVGCFSGTLFCSSVQKFSIGLRSGLFPGHSNILIFFILRKSVTIFARWHGVPSCINISQICTAMSTSLSLPDIFCHSWWFRDRGRIGRPFLALKLLPKSSPLAGVSWFAV